jgi:hypothetical protein
MFETTSRIAEKLATGVSRRVFLGSLGRCAGATALGLAGVLTTVGTARANLKICCKCCDLYGTCYDYNCVALGSACPPCSAGLFLSQSTVAGCGDCKQPDGSKTGGGA